MPKRNETGAEELRRVVNVINGMRESFNDKYTAEELLTLMRMCWACEYDFTPDMWTDKQIKRALAGIVPTWEEKDGETIPTYPDPSITDGKKKKSTAEYCTKPCYACELNSIVPHQ